MKTTTEELILKLYNEGVEKKLIYLTIYDLEL